MADQHALSTVGFPGNKRFFQRVTGKQRAVTIRDIFRGHPRRWPREKDRWRWDFEVVNDLSALINGFRVARVLAMHKNKRFVSPALICARHIFCEALARFDLVSLRDTKSVAAS